MTWPDVWYADSAGARAIRVLLTPFSWAYAVGWQGYRAIYDLGLKKAQAPYDPILVIGNLTVGGSGKTPMTIFVAKELRAMGYGVTIGASGYGGDRSEGAQVAPDGPLDAKIWGDEAAMIRSALPDVRVIVGRNRVRAAELMSKAVDARDSGALPEVLLMDDGFQHLPLAKTASILLDPPSLNHACLPAGPYREPRSNLRRADLVIGPPGSEFAAVGRIIGFVKLSELGRSPGPLPTNRVDALCAIGRPHEFFGGLKGLGIELRNTVALPDHAALSAGALTAVQDPIVVTMKDAVKLRESPEARFREVYVAVHELIVEPRDRFRERLRELIER